MGTAAVVFTFCYVQVASRLDEAMSHCDKDLDNPEIKHSVYCRAWLNRYLYIKETCWLLYFVWLGAWSALVGVVIFLIYPSWRSYRRGRKKRDRKEREKEESSPAASS